MNNPLTNKDLVAGLPAHAVQKFFIESDDTIELESLRDSLMLDDKKAGHVLQLLMQEGYLEASSGDGATAGLVKSNKTQHFMDISPGTFLEKEIALGLAVQLLREVAAINGTAMSANTVYAVQFIGEILGNISGGTAFVEASISFSTGEDADVSRQMIMDRLLGIHPQLCLRVSEQ
jgi:hypothetical protein